MSSQNQKNKIVVLFMLTLLRVVASCFSDVAASFHATPTAAAVFGHVEVEEAAFVVVAASDAVEFIGR